MWAPLSIALLIGFLAQATNGTIGLAIFYGILLLAVVGITVTRRSLS